MMFYLFSGVLILAMGSQAGKGGRAVLWMGWLAGMLLVPTWIANTYGSLTMDLRAVGGGLGLLALVVLGDPGATAKLNRRVVLADVMILILFLVQVYSQKRIGRFGPLTAPDIARRWVLPYLVGRVFFASANDITRLMPVAAKLFMGLSVFAVFESVTKVHPINKALGKTFGILEAGEGYRWGLKRAQGPLDHPIFFGMMLVLLWPWIDEVRRRSKAGEGPKWWKLLAPMAGAAIFGTVSRGAQISLVVTLGVAEFFRRPRWRVAILVCAVVGGGTAVVARQVLKEVMSKWAGETEEDVRLIEINGGEYEYTGTNHRVLLFEAYRDPIRETGAFGYGYELQGIDLEESVALRFSSIDDHYILFLLQYGYVGLGAFLILSVVSLINLGILAWVPGRNAAGMAGVMFGALASVTVGLLSVWFSPDFGAVYLFCTGLAANLQCLPDRNTTACDAGVAAPAAAAPAPARAGPPRPRLVAAHAPVRRSTDGNPRQGPAP